MQPNPINSPADSVTVSQSPTIVNLKEKKKVHFQQNRSQSELCQMMNKYMHVIQNKERKKKKKQPPNRYCTRYMLENNTGSCLSA